MSSMWVIGSTSVRPCLHFIVDSLDCLRFWHLTPTFPALFIGFVDSTLFSFSIFFWAAKSAKIEWSVLMGLVWNFGRGQRSWRVVRASSSGILWRPSSRLGRIFRFCYCNCLRLFSMLVIFWRGISPLSLRFRGWYNMLLFNAFHFSLFVSNSFGYSENVGKSREIKILNVSSYEQERSIN